MIYFIIITAILACLAHWGIYHTALPEVIWGDGVGYYQYLPATFIYHDWNMGYYHPYQTVCISDIGKIILRNPMGTAYLMSPFFGLSHLVTYITGIEPLNGESFFYQKGVCVSTFFYWALGISILYKILREKFEKNISLITCITITFGCGMFYYITFLASYSHIYSFFAIALFMYLVIHEKELKNKCFGRFYYFYLGALLGLIALIRNVNILIFIFYLLYDVKSWADFRQKLEIKKLIMGFSGGFLVWIPQMIYWKSQGGSYLINTYTFQNTMCKYGEVYCFKEHFEFPPHFLKNLFSLEKGLFFYYPVLIFSILGFFFLKKYENKMFYSIILFILPMTYLICSWNQWWYGLSFGQRPYIDFMALFAIPLACFFNETQSRGEKFFIPTMVFAAFLTLLSLWMMIMIWLGHMTDIGSIKLW